MPIRRILKTKNWSPCQVENSLAQRSRWRVFKIIIHTLNLPRFGFCLPAKIFNAVDLPIPFVPTSPNTSPGRGMGNLKSQTKMELPHTLHQHPCLIVTSIFNFYYLSAWKIKGEVIRNIHCSHLPGTLMGTLTANFLSNASLINTKNLLSASSDSKEHNLTQ